MEPARCDLRFANCELRIANCGSNVTPIGEPLASFGLAPIEAIAIAIAHWLFAEAKMIPRGPPPCIGDQVVTKCEAALSTTEACSHLLTLSTCCIARYHRPGHHLSDSRQHVYKDGAEFLP